jgi:TolB-like protein
MTRTRHWLTTFAILTCLTPSGSARQEKAPAPALAVLPFDVGTSDQRGELVAQLLTTHLSASFPIVERQALAKVLAEQELQRRGLLDPEQALQVGRLVGAKLLVTGRVLYLGENTLISARVIAVETSRVKGLNLPCPGELSAEQVAQRLATELQRDLPRWQEELRAPAPAAPAQPVAPLTTGPPVAVINFANLGQGDSRWDWLGKGLADLTINSLVSQGLRVVSREQMQEAVRELEIKNAQLDTKQVATVLRAALYVHGQYQVQAGKVQLHAALIEAQTGRQRHRAAVTGPQEDLLVLQRKLAAELIDVLKGNRPGTLEPARLPHWTDSLTAAQLLYQGIEFFDRGKYLDAWGHFRRALKQDAGYADALYWAGRMMYYVQEYHQARVDLERFAVAYPRHPRVGDAVQEIIAAAQQTCQSAGEMLNVLACATQLAPRAEVHNQFGAGNSSIVAVYAAGLAAQILVAKECYREAVEQYAAALAYLPPRHPLYWVTWHDLFALRQKHLQVSGEALPLPPAPPLAEMVKDTRGPRAPPLSYPLGLPDAHPTGDTILGLNIFGNTLFNPNDPSRWEFHAVTPARPTTQIDFAKSPLTPYRRAEWRGPIVASRSTFTRYFYTPPGHFLASLDVEVHYRQDPAVPCMVYVEGDARSNPHLLDGSGVFRAKMPMLARTRGLGLRLTIATKNPVSSGATTAAVLSWKVTAQFTSSDPRPPGTLVLHGRFGVNWGANVDNLPIPFNGYCQVENLPPGEHTLALRSEGPERQITTRYKFRLAPHEVLELELSTAAPDPAAPPPEPGPVTRISSPSEVFRLGPRMGDQAGHRPGDVRFFEDYRGDWLVIWSMGRDLYLIRSSDRGRTWTPTRALPTPVNSAHPELLPVLGQDRDGRYLLAFVSDRNLQRSYALYVCWSEDLVHFSAPVRVTQGPAEPLRFIHQPDGNYRLYCYSLNNDHPWRMLRNARGNRTVSGGDTWAVVASPDLVHWSRPTSVAEATLAMDLLEQGGRYYLLDSMGEKRTDLQINEMLAASIRSGGKVKMDFGPPNLVTARTSADGLTFSPAQKILLAPREEQVGGRKETRLLRPAEIHLRHSARGPLALVADDGGWAAILALEQGERWKEIAQPRFPRLNQRERIGDFYFEEHGFYYFGVPESKSLSEHLLGRAESNSIEILGEPVFMYRSTTTGQFQPPRPPSDQTPAQVRVVRRYLTTEAFRLHGREK